MFRIREERKKETLSPHHYLNLNGKKDRKIFEFLEIVNQE